MLESIGTVVTATSSEIATPVMTVIANGPKIKPCKPGISSSGTNTVTTVIDDAITAEKICAVALRAASSGDSPSSRWRKMFSMTTTASSTIKPDRERQAAERHRVERLVERYAAKSVPSTETGSETETISVERHECKKSRMTSTASTAPRSAVCSSAVIASR